MAERVGEVIESRSTEFVAQCYRLHKPPALGSLVRVRKDEIDILAVVSDASTGQKALNELLEENLIGRTGQGKRGDPHRYFRKVSATTGGALAERKPDAISSKEGVAVIHSATTPTSIGAERNQQMLTECSECGARVHSYDAQGKAWCQVHGPGGP